MVAFGCDFAHIPVVRIWSALTYVTAVISIIPSISFADTLLLKCIGTDAFNRADGKFTIVQIDQDQQAIVSTFFYPGGSTPSHYGLTKFDNLQISGSRTNGSGGVEYILVDRISGRMTINADVTASKDKLYNVETGKIGFDTKPGQTITSTVTFECAKAEKKF